MVDRPSAAPCVLIPRVTLTPRERRLSLDRLRARRERLIGEIVAALEEADCGIPIDDVEAALKGRPATWVVAAPTASIAMMIGTAYALLAREAEKEAARLREAGGPGWFWGPAG